MKKALMMLLVLAIAFAMVACGEDEPAANGTPGGVTGVGTASDNWVIAFNVTGARTFPAGLTYYVSLAGGFSGMTNVANGETLVDWEPNTAPLQTQFDLANLMTKAGSVYSINIGWTNDEPFTGALAFKIINCNTNMVEREGFGGGWEKIGAQSTGTENTVVTIVEGAITKASNAGAPKGTGVISGNTVTLNLLSFGNWSVDYTGVPTIIEKALTINWTKVPESHTKGVLWADLADGNAVVTGSAAFLHTDGTSTWAPALGKAVTVTTDGANGTATIILTVPAGTPLGFDFKLANKTGWDNGEEANNQNGVLEPDTATQTIAVEFSL
jgi:hypothetical protein